MTLYKKDGMWISDWSNKSDPYDAQGCRERQREQVKKAKALVAKMKTQGWKRVSGKKAKEIMEEGISEKAFPKGSHIDQIWNAIESHDKDIKKKWGQKKVKMGKLTNASRYFLIGDWIWHIGTATPLDALSWGELGGYSALLNKGNQYRIIFTHGSDDDEAGYWSKPVTQLAFKSTAAKAKAKAPAKKPVAKPRAKAKPKKKPATKPKYYLHFGEDYTADKCPYTGKKFAMNTIRSAKALANHIFNLGPMPNMSSGYAEFTIDGEHYGNMAYSWPEIIEAKTGEVVDYWKPSKEQKAAYRKKANAIKKAAKPAAKKPKAKPRAKAPARKPKAKTTRPSPSQSAAATKVGTRKRGNDGFMWEVKKNKNGVHRWARDTKSTKRAEDYWYWKL